MLCTYDSPAAGHPFYLVPPKQDDASDDANGRDVLNEKPTAEEARVVAETQNTLGKQAVIRTTMGDIHMKLFREECPRTVENFSVHSRNGYYDNVLFHRVIKVRVVYICPNPNAVPCSY